MMAVNRWAEERRVVAEHRLVVSNSSSSHWGRWTITAAALPNIGTVDVSKIDGPREAAETGVAPAAVLSGGLRMFGDCHPCRRCGSP